MATLEGDPISLGKARLLACEGLVIPNVFNYRTGEAIELGRALRLPNSALRRKLELEQPGGCAWSGCLAPVQWTEAHHIRHWANGGPTVAANLILLCRFHHGRIHTPGWTITKTGPGKALIVHHEGHEDTDPDLKCGCSDWRTDADLDADFAEDIANAFPTGLYPEEWSETLKPDLEAVAEQAETEQVMAAAKAARAKVRARFITPAPQPEAESESRPASAPAREPEPGQGCETSTPLTEPRRTRDLVSAAPAPDYRPPPVLIRPLRNAVAGNAPHTRPARNRTPGSSPSPCPGPEPDHQPPRTRLTAELNPTRHEPTDHLRDGRPPPPSTCHSFCRRHSAAGPATTLIPPAHRRPLQASLRQSRSHARHDLSFRPRTPQAPPRTPQISPRTPQLQPGRPRFP
ncbi:hypothetical protein GCM10028833_02490 [Glycomyces tarimensis]